ncbi:UDP-N-acetylmuramoyl-tripeptide--D-alanyl-D-alanine ligase [Clostridium acetireducens DSM 10703]|uniref:UDP-N-acetylmuramoyl-tripeptide--D-alanyl-D-alanine ligase n=1 Tax=Clostridium acetireducens DSM 10703 TaxID=1121290 RepID=A0A1E8F2H2_9CLOT|nr:UDP-N-acetylmuramoyl-tripeptide--D-alanyl-D-alanine ligase [Clostridium acetireducens]OFI07549.1 UDP-N-acetylmuramoyl-tripeptide--D-alanyl-D-alanine ligase [Clostridium acetireducens DSM 10703]
MKRLDMKEIVKGVLGSIIVKGNSTDYNTVCTDTRKIQKGNIFVALKGENFNGNEFVKEASEKGAVICVVDEVKFNKEDIKDYTTVIKVEYGKQALLDIAKLYRSLLDIKIVAITGSTGKTSTKDLVAAALSSKYKVYKTEGNYNNEIGLPLSIFNLNENYDVAVLEMGMNHFSEIHRMADAARPDIAIITNIGVSHIENLKSRENILMAKLEITDYFKEGNTLIVNADNDLLSNLKADMFEVNTIGIDNEKADLKAENIVLKEDGIEFDVLDKEYQKENFKLDVLGKHNVLNALLAIDCAKKLDVEYKEMKYGFKKLEKTSMRLDIIKGSKFTIIDDSYNASTESMKAAIDVLKNLKCKRKVAILGTMFELGEESYNEHKKVGEYAKENGIDMLITLGDFNKAFEKGFVCDENRKNYKGFKNYSKAIKYILENIEEGDAVLVKASRSMKFEKIVNKLNADNC